MKRTRAGLFGWLLLAASLCPGGETPMAGGFQAPAGCPLARKEHPRIFITKETLPEVKARCQTSHKALFARMRAACDKGEGGAIQHALCYLATGDRRYAAAAKQSIWKNPEQRPGQESVALDWIYDTLTQAEIQEIGSRMLRKGLWDPDHDHSRSAFRDLVWWNQHYAYTFSETFMKDLFLYGEGVDDAAVARSLGDKVRCLKSSGAAVGINDGHGFAPGSPKFSVMPLLGSRAGDRVCQWMANQYAADPKSHYGYGGEFWCAILWHDPAAPATPPDELPPSRLFDGLGWVSMRSGWQPEATFGYFMAGDWFNGHRHEDCGSFIISSRGGYLAIDSGYYSTYQDDRQNHGTKYTAKGVAHNTLFVHDPHERSGGMWDRALRVRDNGGVLHPGHRSRREAEQPTKGSPWDSADITSYEANPLFTYVAADLTGNYRRELDPFMDPKGPAIVAKYTRELLYLAPDVFVIHDRVKTAGPQYTQRVLLHVIGEPEVRAKAARTPELGTTEFDGPGDAVITDGAGRMFVRTLLPEKRVIRRIGGVVVKSVEAAAANKGDGKLTGIKTLLGACTETLDLKCVEGGPGAKFGVTSSVFGPIGTAGLGKPFTDAPRHPQYKNLKLDPHVSFTIEAGAKPFQIGDAFRIGLVSRRFWVGGENPEPSLKWWTNLSHAEAKLDSRRMGGWGRLEIEPAEAAAEARFLTVLYCTGSDVKDLPGACGLLQDAGMEGARITQGERTCEVLFRAAGGTGGTIKLTETGKTRVDRALAGSLEKEFRR